jgi:ABC-2 type transport system permease protein
MSVAAPAAPDSGAIVFRSARRASFVAFWALLLRDLRVLEKGIGVFAIPTVMQPLLLVFVFTYVFPKIG